MAVLELVADKLAGQCRVAGERPRIQRPDERLSHTVIKEFEQRREAESFIQLARANGFTFRFTSSWVNPISCRREACDTYVNIHPSQIVGIDYNEVAE